MTVKQGLFHAKGGSSYISFLGEGLSMPIGLGKPR